MFSFYNEYILYMLDKYLALKNILKNKYDLTTLKDIVVNINDFDKDKLIVLCLNLCEEIYSEDESDKSYVFPDSNRNSIIDSKLKSCLSINSSDTDDTFNSQSIKSGEHENIITTTTINKSKSDGGYPKLNNYIIIEKIGVGSYGRVYLAYDKKNGKKFAVKVINKSKSIHLSEITILKQISHKNIVSLREIIDCENENQIYVVLNHINGNVITSKQNGDTYFKLPKYKIKKYIRFITSGLKYLHNHKIIHRDIKPENLMVNKKDIVFIIDFGISEILNDEMITNKKSGTLLFTPPEILLGTENNMGPPIDIWSFGVTIFIMLYGCYPFNGNSFEEISNDIINKNIMFPENADEVEIDFINGLLKKNPKERMSLSDIRKHRFMENE